MATNFPSGLDSFTNPSATDSMDSVSVPHASQHANLNDAVEALEAKVGVDGSADTDSLDYKVANFTNKLGSGAAVRVPGTFVGGDVLQAAELNAIGTWQTFTPVFQFGAIGNGTAAGFYCQVNDLVFIRGEFTLGSTSTVSSGFSLEAPINGDTTTGTEYWGSCLYGDASAGNEYLGSMGTFAANRLRFYVWTSSTNWTVTSATLPFTWATGDVVRWQGVYKAA